VAGQDGDGDEAADEEDVEKDCGECEEGDATEAAGKDNCSDGVENSNTGDALDGLFPGRDSLIAVCAYAEEVRVDAWGELACVDSARRDRSLHTEYDGGATKADEVERGLQQAQEAALDETHGGGYNWQSGRMGCKVSGAEV
jgi:hypothetical protein